ncbi:MAG: molybdopterin-dependent oxidoreductase, partial [Gemmatimonadales bacterium]
RAWELDKTASVCTGCSQGCNITLDVRENVVVRVRPRSNLDVNRYFICDHGRMHYRWLNRGDRIEAPLVRQPGSAAGYRAVDWDEALERARGILRGATGRAVALVSPGASTEALFLARRALAGFDWTGAFQLVMGDEAPLPGVPNLALRAERAPNVAGAELVGYTRDFDAALEAAAGAAVVLVLDDPSAAARTAGAVIYLGSVAPPTWEGSEPAIVLPIANVAEEEGTFVSRDGRVQRYLQAKPAPGMARPAWWVLGELGESAERPASAADAFGRLAGTMDAFAGLSYAALGLGGRPLRRAGARAGAGVPA